MAKAPEDWGQDVCSRMPCADFHVPARRTLYVVVSLHLVLTLEVLRTCRCFTLDALYKKSE